MMSSVVLDFPWPLAITENGGGREAGFEAECVRNVEDHPPWLACQGCRVDRCGRDLRAPRGVPGEENATGGWSRVDGTAITPIAPSTAVAAASSTQPPDATASPTQPPVRGIAADKLRFAWWTDVGNLTPFQVSATGPGGGS